MNNDNNGLNQEIDNNVPPSSFVDKDSILPEINVKLPARRVSAELIGDDAVLANILETSLQISGSKMAKDARLISLALKALSKVSADCREISGKRFPNDVDVLAYLERAES
jgi:hypothetical protein